MSQNKTLNLSLACNMIAFTEGARIGMQGLVSSICMYFFINPFKLMNVDFLRNRLLGHNGRQELYYKITKSVYSKR